MVSETLRRRYRRAERFIKPTVIKLDAHTWTVVGPGFKWLGDEYPTWDEAIRAALNGR